MNGDMSADNNITLSCVHACLIAQFAALFLTPLLLLLVATAHAHVDRELCTCMNHAEPAAQVPNLDLDVLATLDEKVHAGMDRPYAMFDWQRPRGQEGSPAITIDISA